MSQKKLKKREEIDSKYKWAIEDMYKDDAAWQSDFEYLSKNAEILKVYEGRLSESSNTLAEYLKKFWETSEILEKVYVYANQKSHENLGNTTYQGLSGKAQNVMVVFSSNNSFFEPEILEMDEVKLLSYIEENEFLKKHEKIFKDILRKKEHILSKEMEEFLSKTEEIASGPSDIFALFNNADLKFPEITGDDGNKTELTHGRYISFMESENREVRKEAFMAMYKTYTKYKNTLAAVYGASVKKDVFYAKARKYDSARHGALDGGNIPVSVYDNLIDTVNDNLNLMHKYVEIRKKALGVEELHMYDLYAPMVKDAKPTVLFEDAKKIVKEGLAPMGDEYLKVLEEGYENGWIDVYENEGKRSGAYSWGAYGVHPYVLLNYQDNLNNVFTLAHEMGHAIHSYYSDLNQPYALAGYRIFVAEVASTCNESLLIHHLIKKTTDKKEKAYLINYFLEQFRGTLFRQTMFAEFEKITHDIVEKGEILTEENLCKLYYELNQKYFGEGMTIDKDIAIEWARIPHFYNAFYVYQYATGFSAAIALSKKIMEKGEPAVRSYLEFIKGGNSKDPIDLLKVAGVDMSSSEPIKAAMETFKDLLEEFSQLS